MQASFLDPRFQNLQSTEDVAIIKSALKKLHNTDPADTTADATLTVKKEKEQTIPSSISKQKSGMEFILKNRVIQRGRLDGAVVWKFSSSMKPSITEKC